MPRGKKNPAPAGVENTVVPNVPKEPVTVKAEQQNPDDLMTIINNLTQQVQSLTVKNQELEQKTKTTKQPAKRAGKKAKDPSKPKRPLTAYLIFSQEHREAVKKMHPDFTMQQIASKLGEMWTGLPDSKKKKYNGLAEEEKEKYNVAIEIWRKKQTKKETKEKAVVAYKEHLEQQKALEFYREHQKKAEEENQDKKKKKKDPNMPKRPKTAFLFFADEAREAIVKQHPDGKAGDWMKIVGENWSKLTAGQKAKYEKQADKAREVYKTAMDAYKLTKQDEKLKVEEEEAQKEKEIEKAAVKYFAKMKKQQEMIKVGRKALQTKDE